MRYAESTWTVNLKNNSLHGVVHDGFLDGGGEDVSVVAVIDYSIDFYDADCATFREADIINWFPEI